MAMEKTESGASTVDGEKARPPPTTNLFRVDVALRILLLALSVSALAVLVTSKQSRDFQTGLPPPFAVVSRDAKFQHVPAFIYLLVALCVASLYSIVTIFASLLAVSRPSPSSARILFLFILFDALMVGVMASAAGSAGSMAYLGLRGNSHANWDKICNRYGKFCRHVGSSVLVSCVAAAILVLLVLLSSYSLYRRSV